MSEQYYIRVRGRVQGPFDGEKLRQLARRGQFSRMHEISIDGQQWQSAQERPELFTVPAIAAVATQRSDLQAVSAPSAAETSRGSIAARTTQGISGGRPAEAWYYVQGGQEQGPIDFNELQELLANRRLEPETEVWRNGMAEWVPAHTIPGLIANAVSPIQISVNKPSQAPAVADSVVQVLDESRGWVVFIAIMAFVYAAILMTSGLLIIILGPRLAADTTAGLLQMVCSVVVAVGGWLAMSFANGITRLHRRQDQEALKGALATLKTLWTYIGMVLVVLLTLGLLGVIVLLSMAGSIAGILSRFSNI